MGKVLKKRLRESRRFIQVVAGPRQTGKTTMVRQVLEEVGGAWHYASADEPLLRDAAWMYSQWEMARTMADRSGRAGAVLVLDEIQKIPRWSEAVKRLWDEDTAAGALLKVVLLGSSPLLMGQGLSESLAGRFEVIRLPHWSFAEMREAFGFTLEEFVFYGAYPGAAGLVKEEGRWRSYIKDSLVETTISRDVLLLKRVDKPALLRRLFELGCLYSGQVVSFTKLLGQLQDAGNTVTLAHYLDLLEGSGMLAGLSKFSASHVRRRRSSPKLQVLNNALMTSLTGGSLRATRSDPEAWGRLVESAVGAHLANKASVGEVELYYWREGSREVDFVVSKGGSVYAIEVKSGKRREALSGLSYFMRAYPTARPLIVGEGGMPLEDFLLRF